MNNARDLGPLEKNLSFSFKDKSLLLEALTHRSFLNEVKIDNLFSNERLEFLGDSVLSFWVAKAIFLKFPQLPEGKLTFIKTYLVRTETLTGLAEKLSLGDYMRMSKGEEQGNGRKNPVLLANCFEAVTGAIFIDQGIIPVFKFFEKEFGPLIEGIKDPDKLKDSKSVLQEKVQASGHTSPVYRLISANGPDHDKKFRMGVYRDNTLLGEGESHSKQEAEEEAAKVALENLPEIR